MEQQELDYGIGVIGLLVCVVGVYLIGLATVKVMADRRVATALEAIVMQNKVGSVHPIPSKTLKDAPGRTIMPQVMAR